MNLPKIDSTWTLFLDRDGVLNRKIENGYVLNPSMLEILPGVLDAMKILSAKFGKIVIVTNQRGIARGLMNEDELKTVHSVLVNEINKADGRIDGIFYCPHTTEDNCNCRKPKTGLALQAKEKFPEIDFNKSILVGDSDSDIEMGNSLEMITVRVGENPEKVTAQFYYPTLIEFANELPG